MDPVSTLRVRRLTGTLASLWAISAVALSAFALIPRADAPSLPFSSAFVAGVAVIHAVGADARAAGIEPGDEWLSIDGKPVVRMMDEGRGELVAGRVNLYRVEKRDGRVLEVALAPRPPGANDRAGDVLLHLALLIVAALYVAVGLAVWWSKPGTAEAWALLLFCSTMTVLISTTIRADEVPWSYSRVLANLPFIGATTFHLFTTYPIEPSWIVRHRRIRAIPYVFAFLIFLGVAGVKAGTVEPRAMASVAGFYGVGVSLASVAVLAAQRRRAHDAGIGERVDLMLLAGVVSFVPMLLMVGTVYALQNPIPWYMAMLWVGFFPLAVGYGMLRKQLFDFRIVARSSAAYGAATFTITGLFAFSITFADELIQRYGVDERSVQVVLLFLAILAFNPVRERTQGLVDRLFDRDRARYRQAVREISEAMVSMLSLGEIGDRILVAVTDTMGVERAMVLLFDENDKVLRPAAWRGDWDEQDIHAEIPSEHPIWKHLWMRREELVRADFDDEPDAEAREECWDIYDTLEVELLVPILFGVDLPSRSSRRAWKRSPNRWSLGSMPTPAHAWPANAPRSCSTCRSIAGFRRRNSKPPSTG